MSHPLRLVAFASVLLAAILVPFALFGSAMDAWTLAALRAEAGPSAVAAVLIGGLLAADVVLPTPSSLVSTAAGAILGFALGAFVGWVGMTVGCTLGYGIGLTGRSRARRLMSERNADRVEALSARFGDWTIVLVRAVPVLAEASVLLAGVTRMNLRRFIALTALSNAGISLVYAGVGAFAAQAGSFLWVFVGAILLPALALPTAKRLARAGSSPDVRRTTNLRP